MKKIPLKKQSMTQQVKMSLQNLKICAINQQGFEHLYLNDSLHLQYCSFTNIDNMLYCINPQSQNQRKEKEKKLKQKLTQSELKQNNIIEKLKTKGVNTIFLNNNVITKIQNLQPLKTSLKILNLSYNRIQKFQGLKQLYQLEILDLSNNKLSFIAQQQIKGLYSLTRLNLTSNLFQNKNGILGIKQLKNNLQIFQMTNNQLFEQEGIELLTEILVYMQKLKILSLKDTQFARKTSNYRKQTIYYIPSLTFLDDRPVTDDQKLLINAWKKGGIKQQRQARKLIVQKKQQKNKNLLLNMQQRNKIVQEKVQKIFQIKVKNQINQLKQLLHLKNLDNFDLKNQDQQNLINLQIQELQKYLQVFKEQCRGLDLDKQLGLNEDQVPKMFIENRTEQCIYIYNVTQKQLDMIKKKHFSNQKLPVIAKNYIKPAEVYWLQDYNQILQKIYNICKGNWQLVELSFNLQIYQFDQKAYRKVRRFKKQQLIQKIKQCFKQEQNVRKIQSETKNKIQPENSLDNLD